MKNFTKHLICSLFLCLSFTAFAQYSPDTYMVSFYPGTTQQEIDQALSDLNSIEIAVSPITETRLWKVKYFPFPYPPTGQMIIDINDTDKKSRVRSETNGGGLNLLHDGINGSSVTTGLKDKQLDCKGLLSTYAINEAHPVSVGVFDTGLNYAAQPSLPGYFFDLGGFNQWDHLNNDPIADDPNGHGSHMASIVSHTINKAYGLNESTIEPQESYEIRKSFDTNGAGHMFEIIDALEHAALNGMNIASCSWSFTTKASVAYDSPLYTCLSTLGTAYNVLIIAAAGNDGIDMNQPINPGMGNAKKQFFPAAYNLPNILTVTTFDCFEDVASFANYGVEDIDIALPGIGLAGLESDNIVYRTGTSQSTALLAGIAANLGSHLDVFHYEPIICAIMDSADEYPNLLGKVKSGGVINAEGALAILGNCENPIEPRKAHSPSEDKIFPNPATDQVSINYTAQNEELLLIYVSDLQGRIVSTKRFDVQAGKNKLWYDLENLNAGLYNICIQNSENLKSYKIIVEK